MSNRNGPVSPTRDYPSQLNAPYLKIYTNIEHLDQSLSSDMLNYIMVVVKLFMKASGVKVL